MEEKYLKDYTVKEFFKFLEDKKPEVKKIISDLEKKKSIYDVCCGLEKVLNPNIKAYEQFFYCYKDKIKYLLKSKQGKERMINVLKDVFGYKFFDFNEEEMNQLENEKMFTRRKLKVIFEDVTGFGNKYNINIPTNWYELTDVIKIIIDAVDDGSINFNEKQKYLNSLKIIENLIAGNYKEIVLLKVAEEELLGYIDETCKLYKQKKLIDVHERNNVYKDLLNHGLMNEKIDENGKVYYEEVGFGDLTISFIEEYNKEIKRVEKQKEIKNMVNKYYKDITKTPFEYLKNEQFPSYQDPDVKILYTELINKLGKKKDDKRIDLHSIALMIYAGYVQSEYYVDDEELENDKKLTA